MSWGQRGAKPTLWAMRTASSWTLKLPLRLRRHSMRVFWLPLGQQLSHPNIRNQNFLGSRQRCCSKPCLSFACYPVIAKCAIVMHHSCFSDPCIWELALYTLAHVMCPSMLKQAAQFSDSGCCIPPAGTQCSAAGAAGRHAGGTPGGRHRDCGVLRLARWAAQHCPAAV